MIVASRPSPHPPIVESLTSVNHKVRRYLLAAALLLGCGLLTWVVGGQQRQRQWFDLQHRQMAAIERLGDFPPAGWSGNAWKNALVTPHNVWGNVTYHPEYSKISNQEMWTLLAKLERIVAETTPDNSVASVDRVFQLLLARGWRTEFVSGYRDEFRMACQ